MDLADAAFREHYPRVYRYLRRRTRSGHQAEELAQRVFADAAATLGQLEPGSSVLAWLYTVARRRLADEARRLQRTATVPLEEERIADVEYGPGLARAIGVALAALPVEQRTIVVAKLVQGRRFAEISKSVGASEDACKMRFSRGLRRLRELLEAEGIEP